MSKKSWVAMTGLGVLMATSAAQAHLIPICVEAYESGTEVSGAGDGVTRAHVTFTRAGGQAGAVAAVGAKSAAWSKAKGKAAPYWSASAGPIGHCVQRDLSYSRGQQSQASDGVAPDAGVRLAFVTAVGVLTEASVDQATELVGLDASGQTRSPWAWSVEAGNRLAVAPVNSFNQTLGQLLGTVSSPAGYMSRIPLQASNQALGQPSARPTSAAGNNNGSISTPVGGKDGSSVVDGTRDDAQANQVPEPETLALLMVGLLGVALASRRRRELAAKAD